MNWDIKKTRYHLLIPKSLDPDFAKAEIIAMDRLDLGDGEYTSPYEQIIAEKNLAYLRLLKPP
ncbi:hypothetical protein GCM10020331_008280 [Ectobacillus funiculus]